MGLEKLINREIKITIGVVLFVSILFIALSYAIFKVDKSGASDVIKFGDISLSFCKDSTCASNVSNIGNIIGTETDSNGNTVYSKIYPVADPVTNDDWNNLKPYIFTLTNTGSLPLYVSIFLERDMTAGVISDGTSEYSEFVSDDQVKIGFGVQGETPTIGLYSDYLNTTDNNHKIASNIQIGVGETKIFNLYAWLKSDAQNASLGKYFVTQISTSAVYCNDRSLGTGQTYSASSKFNFASYYRMDMDTNGAKANPSYNCTDIRDAFSVDNTSAKLSYPVSLMTADEIVFAGGVVYKSMDTPYAWFISNSVGTQIISDWWSLSPVNWVDSDSGSYFWYCGTDSDNLMDRYVSSTNAVRPAISLKSCVKTSGGDGTSSNPYTIKETTSGC